MKKIGFAGSFDPITNGHVYVVNEALKLADTVEIIIAVNPSKSCMFTGEERFDMIKNVFKDKPVNVHLVENEYVASYMASIDCTHMIRGIRNGTDFEYEKLIQRANMTVFGGVQTLFVIPPSDLESVSSSFVKGLIGPQNWTHFIKNFIPTEVFNKILNKKIEEMVPQYKLLPPKLKNIFYNCYTQPNRYYHNLEHIYNMLVIYEKYFSSNIFQNNEVVWAILLHDIVYKKQANSFLSFSPKLSDEENSAMNVDIFVDDSHCLVLIKNLILATDFQKTTQDYLENVIKYVDMYILCSPPDIYDEYAKNIRKEYQEYSDIDYKVGRLAVLNTILDKITNGQVFNIGKHYKLHTEQATINISREIERLENENSVGNK
ncbi:MAG: phosphopantetheine adenylyltransferase [Caudoviricetes sp.]|nr:MAG: phosphopantetheine adenylyltransferase [Caudoviricetes sp.]